MVQPSSAISWQVLKKEDNVVVLCLGFLTTGGRQSGVLELHADALLWNTITGRQSFVKLFLASGFTTSTLIERYSFSVAEKVDFFGVDYILEKVGHEKRSITFAPMVDRRGQRFQVHDLLLLINAIDHTTNHVSVFVNCCKPFEFWFAVAPVLFSTQA